MTDSTTRLHRANECLRDGDLLQALELYAGLCREQPAFLPYRQGFELAQMRITARDDAGVSRNGARLVMEAMHPASMSFDSCGSHAFFAVVTSVFNGSRFLEESLKSVLEQRGDFFVDYLIKDARSTDGTLAMVIDTIEAVRRGEIPLNCLGLRIRLVSGPDDGLYDALEEAFSTPFAFDSPNDIMAYINSDDVYVENAFAIVAAVFRDTGAEWLCGQPCVMDGAGKILVTPIFPLAYARQDIARGLHDGRTYYFIQQEGTFWQRGLYKRAGGIDRTQKLAGDFDLWCRFAQHAELLAVDRPLARFRTHPTQLSKQMEKYYAEVDRSTSRLGGGGVFPECSDSSFKGRAGPALSARQGTGPVCFLTADCKVREIAYLRRVWVNW